MSELGAALVALAVEAARVGDLGMVERALGAGVPVESRSARGDSLLMVACHHGHVPIVRALLARGADPNTRDARGQRPWQAPDSRGWSKWWRRWSKPAPSSTRRATSGSWSGQGEKRH